MDIKATQLKNNTQIADVSPNTVRTPAKAAEDGKSFIDAMSDLPKFDADNSLPQKVSAEAENKVPCDKENKAFEFISKTENDFNIKNIQNSESMTVQERQAMHKIAEKELVDEIVLMNNKHNSNLKNPDKNEMGKSEISVAKKSEKQIDAENFDAKSDVKFISKSDIVNEDNFDKQVDLLQNKNVTVNPEKEVSQENFEIIKSETPNSEAEFIKQDVKMPEVLAIAEGEVEELLLPDKNIKEEIFPQPEILEQFEEPKYISAEEFISSEQTDKGKNEVVVELADAEINIKDKDIISKSQKFEEKSFSKTEEVLPEKVEVKPSKAENKHIEEKHLNKTEEVLPEKVEVKLSKVEDKTFEVKDIDLNDKKNNISENNVKPEKFVQEKSLVKPSSLEKDTVQKSDDKKLQKAEMPKENVIAENEVVQEVKAFEKPEKVAFVENLINQNKIDEKKDLKNDKPSLSKISNVKKDILNEVENVGKVKDIADEVKVNAVEMKPVVPEDIKVIKMEIVNPLAELNNSLSTTKTSDIVKFIDANLSTNNVKTTKTSSSKSAESAKKSSAEKAIKMTEADAKFFNNLIETNQQVIEGTKTADQANNNLLKDVETAQSAQVSKTLLNALKESQENNKAFRVDFDKDISVVLRVNKDGHISAEFLPGDEAVEQYLKSNIPLLKQKFSDEGLEYDNLSYRQHKKEDKERQNRGNKKENGYE